MNRDNTFLHYGALDKTVNWNYRLKDRSQMGMFMGGFLTTVAAELRVLVGGDVGAVSADGMVVLDNSTSTTSLTVTAGTTQWVVLYVKYHVNADPTVEYAVFSDVVYQAHVDKAFMIVLAKITLGGGAVDVQPADIDYTVRHDIDTIGRSQFRGCVANTGSLPIPTPTTNRDADIYFVVAEEVFYYWDGTVWLPTNTLSSAAHIAEAVFQFGQIQAERSLESSGLITDIYVQVTAPTEDGTFEGRNHIVQQPAIVDQVDIANVSAYMHGHFIHVPYVQLTLAAQPAPAAPDRYDGIWIEAYRIEVADPTAYTFAVANGAALTFAQMRELFEQFDNHALFSANSVYISSIEYIEDKKYLATVYVINTQSSVGIASVYDQGATMMGAVTNVDGNAFAQTSAKAAPYPGDTNIWYSASATAYDGISWGLPLYVIRRTANEDFTIANAIKWFRADDGMQQIFEVYPRVHSDIAKYHSRASERSHTIDTASDVYGGTNVAWAEQYRTASGVLRGINEPIVGKDESAVSPVAANSIRIPEMSVAIRGRIFEIPETDLSLGVAPGAGAERSLVTLAAEFVKYPAAGHLYDGTSAPRAWSVTDAEGNLYYAALRYVVDTFDVAADDVIDVYEAVDALTDIDWVTDIDPTKQSNADVGLLRKPTSTNPAVYDTLLQVPLGDSFYIPICFVHRLNQAAWHVTTNHNGGSGRPDSYVHDVIEKDYILDSRRLVCQNEEDVQMVVEQSMERLMQGRLRTQMVRHPVQDPVAGVLHTYNDWIADGTAVPGTAYVERPGIVDGVRSIWSEAEELMVLATTFTLTFVGPNYVYACPELSYLGAPIIYMAWDGNVLNDAILSITAPVNCHLVLDPITDEPVWVNNSFFGTKATADIEYLEDLLPFLTAGWTAGGPDSRGNRRAVQTTFDNQIVTKATYTYNLAFLVKYPRGYTGDADSYDNNRGTFGNQDKLISVNSTNLFGDVGVTPRIAEISKVVLGSPTAVSAAEITAAAGIASDFMGIPIGVDSIPDVRGEPLDTSVKYPRINKTGSTRASYTPTVSKTIATGDLSVTHPAGASTFELVFPYTPVAALGPYTDVWAELGRASKAFQGYFGWAKCVVTLPAAWVSGNEVYLDMSRFVTNHNIDLSHAFFRRGLYGADVYLWYDDPATPGDRLLANSTQVQIDWDFPWAPGPPELPVNYGTIMPLVITEGTMVPGTTQIEVWAIVCIPPESTENIAITYQGTPYQGSSNTGALLANTSATEEHFFGQVRAVSDMYVTSQGSGVQRHGSYITVGAHFIDTHQYVGQYKGINPALTYMPRLGSASFRDFDMYDEGAVFWHTPQIDPTSVDDAIDPWDIKGQTLVWTNLSEVGVTTTRFKLDGYRYSSTDDVFRSHADILKAGLVLTKPDMYALDTWSSFGWINGDPTIGIYQGKFFAHNVLVSGTPAGRRVRDIAVPIPQYLGHMVNWLNLTGLHSINNATDNLYGFDGETRVRHVSASPHQTTLVSTPGITLVGYVVKTNESAASPRITEKGNLMLVVFSDFDNTSARVGSAFDVFYPLYNPVLPLYPETGPSY